MRAQHMLISASLLLLDATHGLSYIYQNLCCGTLGFRSLELQWLTGCEGSRICALLSCGNYAGSIKPHELNFCAQASCKQNLHYAGTAQNQPPQPTPAQDNRCMFREYRACEHKTDKIECSLGPRRTQEKFGKQQRPLLVKLHRYIAPCVILVFQGTLAWSLCLWQYIIYDILHVYVYINI